MVISPITEKEYIDKLIAFQEVLKLFLSDIIFIVILLSEYAWPWSVSSF